MLARLSRAERQRLLGAMLEIEVLLGSSGAAGKKLLTAKGAKVSQRAQRKAGPPQSMPGDPYRDEAAAYTLRAHRPGDVGWVVQRHGELYWQEYRYDERFEALVAEIVAEFVQKFDPKRERCWIAEKNGERVGTIFLVKQSNMVAKLRLLLVEPSARGLGIGKRLVSVCVEFARKSGYKTIMLWTQSELHAARHLYEQAGFRRIAQKPHQSWGRTDLTAETWQLCL
jgi:GNAT superfamily N-acetyltransferase